MAQGYPALLSPFLNMSAGFSGHLPERMLGAWRPGSEGDWCLCHPSQELPLSWCIIEPLNQLLPHCHHPPNCPGWKMGAKGKKHNKGRLTEKSRLCPSSSLIYTCGVMGLCFVTRQQLMETHTKGLCGCPCQALTVHCVKLVIITSLKPCPVAAACWGWGSRQDLEAGCVCQGGKSLLWWGGKHYGQLYRHRLLWHI